MGGKCIMRLAAASLFLHYCQSWFLLPSDCTGGVDSSMKYSVDRSATNSDPLGVLLPDPSPHTRLLPWPGLKPENSLHFGSHQLLSLFYNTRLILSFFLFTFFSSVNHGHRNCPIIRFRACSMEGYCIPGTTQLGLCKENKDTVMLMQATYTFTFMIQKCSFNRICHL